MMGVTQSLLLATDLIGGLLQIILWVTGVAGTLVLGYALYLSFLMMTTADDGKRKSAKTRMIRTWSSFFIILFLVTALAGMNTVSFIKVSGSGGNKSLLEDAKIINDPVITFNSVAYRESCSVLGPGGYVYLSPGGDGYTYNKLTGECFLLGTNIQLKTGVRLDSIIDCQAVQQNEVSKGDFETYFGRANCWNTVYDNGKLTISYQLYYGATAGQEVKLPLKDKKMQIKLHIKVSSGSDYTNWGDGWIAGEIRVSYGTNVSGM